MSPKPAKPMATPMPEITETSKIATKPKMHTSPNTKPQVGAGSLVKSPRLHFKDPPTIQQSKSHLAPTSTKMDVGLYKSNPGSNRKVSIKPTPKLIQAIESLGPDSKPIQVKLVRRESEGDEDTSSYESDSSGGTLAMRERGSPKAKGENNGLKADIAALLQKANIDLSQIPEKKASVETDFSGIPEWFPLKIKRILKDDGFPDALPFKASHCKGSRSN